MLPGKVQQFIADRRLLEPESRVLVGVSGGVDSMVLLRLLGELGYVPVAAHVNYGLRGKAADQDEALVRSVCRARDIPLHVAHRDAAAHARERGLSVQEAARNLRYAFFVRLAERENLPCVAVGHHRDDQAETVLLNLFRGSGPEGIAGMAPRRRFEEDEPYWLVRPLLEVGRAAVEAYARAEDVRWRTDKSNASTKYRRGALRSVILPQVEEHFGEGVSSRVARAAALMHDYVEATWQPALQEHWEACAEETLRGGRIKLEPLRRAAPVWQRRLVLKGLRCWVPGAPQSAAVAREVISLLSSQPGRRVEFKEGTVWRERGQFTFCSARPESSLPASGKIDVGEALQLRAGTLYLEGLEEGPADFRAADDRQAVVDLARLTTPLTVRLWQRGDRFQPLGMQHTKKVSDFLTDVKIPPSRRAEVLVVCSGKEIVWIAGYRLAEPARVRESSKHLAKLTFMPVAS